jgi:hypothetical protein
LGARKRGFKKWDIYCEKDRNLLNVASSCEQKLLHNLNVRCCSAKLEENPYHDGESELIPIQDFLFFDTGSCYVAQTDLELEILVPLCSKCWDYRVEHHVWLSIPDSDLQPVLSL